MPSERKPTDKQRVFCEIYLQTWNGTESARQAKYKGNDVTLAAVAYENLRKPHIRKYIEQRLTEITMKSNEVLLRLSQQATASISDFIKPVGNLFMIDMDKVRAKGHLVKKIKYVKDKGVEIELYDSQAALVHLGRHHQLFTDKIKVEDWRSDVIQLFRDGKITQQDIIDELGKDLATELFISAGIPVHASGQMEGEGNEGV